MADRASTGFCPVLMEKNHQSCNTFHTVQKEGKALVGSLNQDGRRKAGKVSYTAVGRHSFHRSGEEAVPCTECVWEMLFICKLLNLVS